MAQNACKPRLTPDRGRAPTARRAALAAGGAVLATVVACGTVPKPGEHSSSADAAGLRTTTAVPAPDSAIAQAQLVEPSAAPLVAAEAGDQRRGFSTRHAHFSPATWSQLPGWRDDDLSDAWRAFLQSCSALARKPGWDAACGRAAGSGRDKSSMRGFFEREFSLYEIRNSDRTPDGVITGYYEPLLTGSRTRQGAYIYPVYGVPADMLTLDGRLWPVSVRGQQVGARLDRRQVIPMPGATRPNAPYVLDVGGFSPDDRDKKFRLRLDGDRLLPYFTRAEIERIGLPQAPVLAWVDNPAALYSMQIQGSGKIRLPDGRMLRLAYAEQNGHPFNPPGKHPAGGAAKARMTTRGLNVELPHAEVDADVDTDARRTDDPDPRSAGAHTEPLTRGLGTLPSRSRATEVELVIEHLAGTAAKPGAPRKATPAPLNAAPPAAVATQRLPAPDRPQPAPTAPARASPQMLAAISSDPSFVFFREIPDGPGGPIGALGVPLTAGRSVAVDPRTTPLGFPVFLATEPAARGSTALRRLMMAQDTGGAIRGAVRADYFWGFGADAYARAAGMKQSGRMWLLMPRGLQVAARDPLLTRGVGNPPALPDCVIPDDNSCVEDR